MRKLADGGVSLESPKERFNMALILLRGDEGLVGFIKNRYLFAT